MSASSFTRRLKLKARNAWLSAWLPISGWTPGKRAPLTERILNYHGVAPKVLPGLNGRFVDLQRFREEMKLLKRCHQVVSLEQLEQGEFDKKRFAVALTFDDGYANNLRYAIPVLQELELPATFFVTAIRSVERDILWPDLVNLAAYEGISAFDLKGERYVRHGVNSFRREKDGMPLTTVAWQESDPGFIPALEVALEAVSSFRKRQEWRVYWEQSTAQEIGEMAVEHRFAIGSHSIRHQNLASLSPTAAQQDLAMSKKWLEEVTGKPIERIAYPGGWASASLHEATFEAGYRQIYLDTYRNAEEAQHPHMHQRFGSHPKLSALAQMYYLERGAY